MGPAQLGAPLGASEVAKHRGLRDTIFLHQGLDRHPPLAFVPEGALLARGELARATRGRVGACRRVLAGVSAHAGQGCPCRARRAGPGVGALSNPLMQVPLAPLGGEAAGRAGTRARAPGTSLRERRPLVPASTDPRAPCRPSLAGGASRADALSSHALAAAEAHQGTGRVGHACGYELRVYLRGRSAWDIPGALLRDQIRNSAKLRCTIVPA